MPLRLALGVRGTVAGHRLGALEGGGGGGTPSPFQCIPALPPPSLTLPLPCPPPRRTGKRVCREQKRLSYVLTSADHVTLVGEALFFGVSQLQEFARGRPAREEGGLRNRVAGQSMWQDHGVTLAVSPVALAAGALCN